MEELNEDIDDFWVPTTVPVLENPSVVEFLRVAVAGYQPVIIRNLEEMKDWPARKSWDLAFLCDKLAKKKDRVLNVTLTPDGRGDSPKSSSDEGDTDTGTDSTGTGSTGRIFTYPCECSITPALLQQMLEDPQEDDAVPYLSLQNDNLRTHTPELMEDISPSLNLAREAFGADGEVPEAVNLWIGDERSVSSIHKDFFENMYCVISGEKTFTLLPPADVAFLTETELPCRRYVHKEDVSDPRLPAGGPKSDLFTVHQRARKDDMVLSSSGCPSERLMWIDSDPDDPSAYTHHPNLHLTHPRRVVVRAGEILYIPALWYHQVSQTCVTIAVNYWYDMQFDHRWVCYQHMRRSSALWRSLAGADADAGAGAGAGADADADAGAGAGAGQQSAAVLR